MSHQTQVESRKLDSMTNPQTPRPMQSRKILPETKLIQPETGFEEEAAPKILLFGDFGRAWKEIRLKMARDVVNVEEAERF